MSNRKKRQAAAQQQARRQRTNRIAAATAMLATVAVVYLMTRDDEQLPTPAPLPDKPTVTKASAVAIPALAATEFRNTDPSVGYVGSRACLECHEDEYDSYLHTTHSRSLTEVDVDNEPPDGEFFHELSGRHYRVYRDGRTLRLREFIKDDEGAEVVLADHAAKYALGSGHYARMYLSESDDYLIESPMTWYPRRQQWGMSAGYELDPHQPGFRRSVGWGCLNCHAARIDTVDSDVQLRMQEMAISCERCHGPGALHVAERRAGRPLRGDWDDTIVNLRHLSRERKEDVCSQCHLSSAADVMVLGRKLRDFRPGMRMSDFRVSYRIDRDESARTVSGQIEQMRSSRCYIESETMTCATCHNPHAIVEESQQPELYRQQCLNCHSGDGDGCTESAERRAATQPVEDYCVTCHMPKGPTDIPHFSFTHHRIGIHEPDSGKPTYTADDQLAPLADVSHLPELEQRRLLGLANDAFAAKLAGGLDDETRDDPAYLALAEVFSRRSLDILTSARERGLRESRTEMVFSGRYWRQDPERCIQHARQALDYPPVPMETRRDALFKLASSHFDAGRHVLAKPLLEELSRLERNEIVLMLLALCHRQQGKLPEAAELIEQAIEIDPARADLHEALASIQKLLGNAEQAEHHAQRAALLRKRTPQPK